MNVELGTTLRTKDVCYTRLFMRHPSQITPTLSITRALSLVFPNRCLVCHRSLAIKQICSLCWPAVARTGLPIGDGQSSEGWSWAYAMWPYRNEVVSLIQVAKYGPSLKIVRELAHEAASFLVAQAGRPNWELVVPVPSRQSSLVKRGFGVVECLARSIGVALEVPVLEWGLVDESLSSRVRGRRATSARVTGSARESKIRFSHRSTALQAIRGKHILLVDDVFTSGTTARAATGKLIELGCVRVDLFTLALSRDVGSW